MVIFVLSALQDVLFRLSEIKKTSTISTLWNLRDNMKYVQNVMGSIVDNLETFKNVALWTAPAKVRRFQLILL